MLVIFILREPGNHYELFRRVITAVPREGELVEHGDETYVVHQVTWTSAPAVKILLRK